MPWRLDSMNPEFLRKNKEVFADKFSSDELFSVLYRLFTPLQLLCMKKEILERSLAISEILCFKTWKADENIKNDYCSLNNEEWLRKYLRNANSYYEKYINAVNESRKYLEIYKSSNNGYFLEFYYEFLLISKKFQTLYNSVIEQYYQLLYMTQLNKIWKNK